jgi:hypothetical protein
LTGRVRAADDDGVVSRAKLLACGVGRVDDAKSLVGGEMRDRQPAVLNPERKDDAAPEQLVAVFEADRMEAVALAQADRAPGNHGLRVELLGLDSSPLRELCAGESRRSASRSSRARCASG